MSKLMISSDLHLGHKNAFKWREPFSSSEEHDEVIFDNLASSIGKRDTLLLVGDVAFTRDWLTKIADIKCQKKILVMGNHDTDRLSRGITVRHLCKVYDEIHALTSKSGFWISHAPIHPDEMRNRFGNIHGHTHGHVIDDPRYINVCLEQTDWRPISFQQLLSKHQDLRR